MIRAKRATGRRRVREAPPTYGLAAPERLLLDTQVWLWWRADDRRLGPAAWAAIRSAANVWFSVASAWEIAIKKAAGKLELPGFGALTTELKGLGFQVLAIEIQHALRIETLPKVHRDPFDRMLAAQALAEELTLVTADPVFPAYGVSVLSARD